MATLSSEEIYTRYIRDLSLEERIRLMEQIMRDIRIDLRSGSCERDWRELAGLLPYPAFGEDAQAYVSRTRREADENRNRP